MHQTQQSGQWQVRMPALRQASLIFGSRYRCTIDGLQAEQLHSMSAAVQLPQKVLRAHEGHADNTAGFPLHNKAPGQLRPESAAL